MLTVTLPIRAESVSNLREHWSKRASRAKLHRSTAYACLRSVDHGRLPTCPIVVKLTRVAPRQLDDDNLRGSLKAARDGVADWLGVPDNDPRIRWDYAQEKGKPKTYAVRVEVAPC
jgi:hypothetical protein